MESKINIVNEEMVVDYILERMMDQKAPYMDRFPIEIIEEGCLCRRLIETVLRWEAEYLDKAMSIDH